MAKNRPVSIAQVLSEIYSHVTFYYDDGEELAPDEVFHECVMLPYIFSEAEAMISVYEGFDVDLFDRKAVLGGNFTNANLTIRSDLPDSQLLMIYLACLRVTKDLIGDQPSVNLKMLSNYLMQRPVQNRGYFSFIPSDGAAHIDHGKKVERH